MKKGKNLLLGMFIIFICIIIFQINFITASQITFGNRVDSDFRIMQDALGFPHGTSGNGGTGFANLRATAEKVCQLTETMYTQLPNVDKPYTVYVDSTSTRFTTCTNDKMASWNGNSWTVNSACVTPGVSGYILDTITCEEAPCVPNCANKQCGSDGCGGTCEITPCATLNPLKPACNSASGQCVQCTSGDTSQCTGSTPYCYTPTNKCVGCIYDENCQTSPNFVCEPITHQCIQCEINQDCTFNPNLPVCDITTNNCVECNVNDNTQCSDPKPVCDIATKNCVECEKKEDCNGNQECNTETHTCFDVVTGEVYWKNMQNGVIKTANLNALVKLSLISQNDLTGTNIQYKIFLKDGGPFWFDEKIAQTSSEGFLEWRAGKQSDESLKPGEYYFGASLDNGETWTYTTDNTNQEYHYLVVSDSQNNNPPTTSIITPINRQIYFENEILTFSQQSSDIDDHFTYKWEANGEEIKSGTDKNLEDFTYQFTKGQKDIVLTVTDDRGKIARKQVSILVIASDFVLSYIDNPIWGKTYFSPVTEFDATGSYAVSSNLATAGTITCLAGNCPVKTQGCPGTNPSYPDCQIPIANTPAPIENLDFLWEIFFKQGNTFTSVFTKNEALFSKVLTQTGDYKAELTSTYPGTTPTSSKTSTIFDLSFTNPRCVIPGDGTSHWESSTNSFDDSTDNCWWSEDLTCCPDNYHCVQATNTCAPDQEQVRSCDEYKTKEECDGYTQTVASYHDPDYCTGADTYEDETQFCVKYHSCKCSWEGTECKTKYGTKGGFKEPPDATCELPEDVTCTLGAPTWDDKCDTEGTITATWKATEITQECQDKTRTFSCEQIVKLPFFTQINTIIAIILIILIYVLFLKFKK